MINENTFTVDEDQYFSDMARIRADNAMQMLKRCCKDCKWCGSYEDILGNAQLQCKNKDAGMASWVEIKPTDFCSYFEADYDIDLIKQPAIDRKKGEWIPVEPKKGEWFRTSYYPVLFKCSNCQETAPIDGIGDSYHTDFDYCPYCGAHMRTDNENKT